MASEGQIPMSTVFLIITAVSFIATLKLYITEYQYQIEHSIGEYKTGIELQLPFKEQQIRSRYSFSNYVDSFF